jgi:hypothetical protein
VVLHEPAEGGVIGDAMRILFVLAGLVLSASTTLADQSTAFCTAAKKILAADAGLASAAVAVFGKTTFKAGEGCVYPLKVLHYASADVLVVQTGEPGEGCHGCGAPLSAYVLRRNSGSLKTVRSFRRFATLGTFGAVGDVSAVEIGADDGMAIESGGTFQGYSSTGLDLYAFQAGRLVSISGGPTTVAADNSGAEPDKAIEVTGKWFFDPTDKTALIVDYKIEARGAVRTERVIWRLQGTSLVLSHGRVPPELSEAGGG